MTENQQKLRQLMGEHKEIGTYSKLAGFWGVSAHTVHAYLKPVASKSHRTIPSKKMAELKSKLGVADA